MRTPNTNKTNSTRGYGKTECDRKLKRSFDRICTGSFDRICYCNSENELPELINEFYCLMCLSLERNRIAIQTKV